MIPSALRRRVENHDMDFIMSVGYMALGLLSQLKSLYGVQTNLVDFEIANVAELISTARRMETTSGRTKELVARAVGEITIRPHKLQPAGAFASVFSFYCEVVGETVDVTLANWRARRGDASEINVFPTVYARRAEGAQ